MSRNPLAARIHLAGDDQRNEAASAGGSKASFRLAENTAMPFYDPAIASIQGTETLSRPDMAMSSVPFDGDSAADEEQTPPPGIIAAFTVPNRMASTRRVFTLSELEQQLGKAAQTPALAVSSAAYFPLRTAVQKAAGITFPPTEPDSDPCRSLMSKYEREGVARIHLAQLTTESPKTEDFYYQNFTKRVARRQRASQASVPLYLPLPNPRSRKTPSAKTAPSTEAVNKAEARAAELASALGRISIGSSQKPHQRLERPPTMNRPALGEASTDLHFGVMAAVERIYEALFALEDVLHAADELEDGPMEGSESTSAGTRTSSAAHDALLLADRRAVLEKVIRGELGLADGKTPASDPMAEQRSSHKLVAFLALPKAKRVVGKALKFAHSDSLIESFVLRLLDVFEMLDVCRHDVPASAVDLFVNSVLAVLVPWIAKCSLSTIETLVERLLDKPAFSWIAVSKTGLIFLCILLSRVEIIKNSASSSSISGDAAAHPPESSSAQWNGLMERLFDRLQEQDRLADVFVNLRDVESEYYGWQYCALLAGNIDADRKRTLVLELRERILGAAQSTNPKAIANLNIFLNALGLDASQLAQQ